VLQAQEQRFPCNPCWSRYPYCSLWRTPCWSRWICPEGNCGLWRHHTGPGFSARNCRPMERIRAGAGEVWGGRSRRDELLWTDHNPHMLSPPRHSRGWEEVEELGMKEWHWVWEEEVEWGEDDFIFVFVSHHPTLFLTDNELNSFSLSRLCFVCDGNW